MAGTTDAIVQPTDFDRLIGFRSSGSARSSAMTIPSMPQVTNPSQRLDWFDANGVGHFGRKLSSSIWAAATMMALAYLFPWVWHAKEPPTFAWQIQGTSWIPIATLCLVTLGAVRRRVPGWVSVLALAAILAFSWVGLVKVKGSASGAATFLGSYGSLLVGLLGRAVAFNLFAWLLGMVLLPLGLRLRRLQPFSLSSRVLMGIGIFALLMSYTFPISSLLGQVHVVVVLGNLAGEGLTPDGLLGMMLLLPLLLALFSLGFVFTRGQPSAPLERGGDEKITLPGAFAIVIDGAVPLALSLSSVSALGSIKWEHLPTGVVCFLLLYWVLMCLSSTMLASAVLGIEWLVARQRRPPRRGAPAAHLTEADSYER